MSSSGQHPVGPAASPPSEDPQVSSSGMLEPAYDVGGDCFDHSANGFAVDVAIMDAMGHGLGSRLISSLAVGSYRHDRREGQPLG